MPSYDKIVERRSVKKMNEEKKKKVSDVIDYNNKPRLEMKYRVSKDGKWFITQTIITDIKSINYMTKVLGEI